MLTADSITEHQVRLARDVADVTSGWRWLFDRILEDIARGMPPALHERERVAEFLNACDDERIIRARCSPKSYAALNARTTDSLVSVEVCS